MQRNHVERQQLAGMIAPIAEALEEACFASLIHWSWGPLLTYECMHGSEERGGVTPSRRGALVVYQRNPRPRTKTMGS